MLESTESPRMAKDSFPFLLICGIWPVKLCLAACRSTNCRVWHELVSRLGLNLQNSGRTSHELVARRHCAWRNSNYSQVEDPVENLIARVAVSLPRL